ncbi:hypothetical protein Avbf_09326 [Armadillidium vulgare]|nr:hypothetical protein Avbf_09326 [Armadillidium vulgare]
MHLAFSSRCNQFASSQFMDSVFVQISKKECYVKLESETVIAAIEFEQAKNRTHDGVPLIVPCSPGGYTVDAYSGRFVVGDPCYRMFSDIKKEESGIMFIIKKIYKNNENLLFPTKQRTPGNIRPIYMKTDGKFIKPERMRPDTKTNNVKGNRPRDVCDYEYARKKLKNYPKCEEIFDPKYFKIPRKEGTL